MPALLGVAALSLPGAGLRAEDPAVARPLQETPKATKDANQAYRTRITDAIRSRLIGRTFATQKDLVEEYKDQGFRVESWREALFANLRESNDGLEFDLIMTVMSAKVPLEKRGSDSVMV